MVIEPDHTLAQKLDHWPTTGELARLQSVEGKPKAVILEALGHPSHVERRPNGEEVWDYPWLGACRVWVRNGVCSGTNDISGW